MRTSRQGASLSHSRLALPPRPGLSSAGLMAGEAKTATRFIEEILNTGDWSSAGEVLQPDVVMYHPSSPEPIRGLEAVQGFLGVFRAGMPDLGLSVEDVTGDGDRVAA